jgi:hypothetical protein
MSISGHGVFISVIALGALVGACAEQFLFLRLIPESRAVSWAWWLRSALGDLQFEGAIAGALVANLGWMFTNPRLRVRRPAMFGIAANAAAWAAFLVAVPPLTPSDFELIHAERTRRDTESSVDWTTHEPVIVAARPYGNDPCSDNGTNLLLGVFAGPAIHWTASLTIPMRYGAARPTRRESFIVAGGGFILSTAFWAALVSAVSSVVASAGGICDSAACPRLLGEARPQVQAMSIGDDHDICSVKVGKERVDLVVAFEPGCFACRDVLVAANDRILQPGALDLGHLTARWFQRRVAPKRPRVSTLATATNVNTLTTAPMTFRMVSIVSKKLPTRSSPNVTKESLQAYHAKGNPTVAHQPGEQRLTTFAAVNPRSHT